MTTVSGATPKLRAPAGRVTARDELVDVVRAVSGGLLFGAPLLYTMEVWWTGTHTDPGQMAALLALLCVPVFVLNKTGGFRVSRDVRVLDAATDTIEAVAIGIVVTAGVLMMVREITSDTPLAVALGKVLYESIPFCLGIGVARHFLQGDRDGADDDSHNRTDGPQASKSAAPKALHPTMADLGATAIGALFISLSIAPTDEVPLITSTMSPAWLLVVAGASLAATYTIVFVAGFSGQSDRHRHEGAFQSPATETIAAYLVALLMAAALLWMFQRGIEPWSDLLSRVIVLGFPAAIGGAAGRLAL